MRRNKVIIVLIVVLLILGAGGIIYKTSSEKRNNTSTPLKTSSSQTINSLDIKNLYIYTNDVDINTQKAIESLVYKKIKESIPETKKIEGVVRNDSFTPSNEGTSLLITFMVDIESIQRSYKVSLGKDESTAESSLYVLCPDASELIYPAFSCEDNANG